MFNEVSRIEVFLALSVDMFEERWRREARPERKIQEYFQAAGIRPLRLGARRVWTLSVYRSIDAAFYDDLETRTWLYCEMLRASDDGRCEPKLREFLARSEHERERASSKTDWF